MQTTAPPSEPPPNAAAPEAPVDVMRRVVEKRLAEQEPHVIYAKWEVDWSLPYDLGGMWVRMGATHQKWSMTKLYRALDVRREAITVEKEDPYRGGYEPEIWHEADWRLAELRCTFPGEDLIIAALGGQGSGKSYYFGKRFAKCMAENEDWLCLQLSLDQDGSREIPQRIIYEHLPPEEKNLETGKRKKTGATKLSYNTVNGFTDDTFGLENKCRANFKFYGGGDINSLEGIRPDLIWADEMVPWDWVRSGRRRLVTKAEKSHALIPLLKEALAARAHKEPDAYEKYLRPLLAKLFQGVFPVSFTPKNGYSRTVANLTEGAKTLVEVAAELLPITQHGKVIGHEKVPRVQVNLKERALIMYFHISDNRHGGNWEAQKKDLALRSREERLWRAYGVATKLVGVQFPLFNRAAQVRPLAWLPKQGCWYHVVDPCSDGRNWFMQWWKCAPNPVGQPLLFCAREWPQPGDFIVAGDVGNPGEWAVLEEGRVEAGRKKAQVKVDGERGPAQRCWGLGYRQYAEEIERVERELWHCEQGLFGSEAAPGIDGRILLQDGCRIMDSRSGNTASQTHGESLTVREIMAQYRLYFSSAGRDSGAEAGSTHVKEGVGMINDRLFYDVNQAELDPKTGLYVFHGHAPSLMIAEPCENTIFALSNWTGQDGGQGATKDPVDTTRYLVIANPQPIEADDLLPYGGGGYGR